MRLHHAKNDGCRRAGELSVADSVGEGVGTFVGGRYVSYNLGVRRMYQRAFGRSDSVYDCVGKWFAGWTESLQNDIRASVDKHVLAPHHPGDGANLGFAALAAVDFEFVY